MATVIRIKRRLDEDPPENIVVAPKKAKKDDGAAAVVKEDESGHTILKRVATLNKEDDPVEPCLRNTLPKSKLSKLSWQLRQYYKNGAKIKDFSRSKKDVNLAASSSRYKIICAKRGMTEKVTNEDDEADSKEATLNVQVFDALYQQDPSSQVTDDIITCNGKPMEVEKVTYVYDLYYTDVPIQAATLMDTICEIKHYSENQLVNDGDSDHSDADNYEDDIDDENDEDNWRNDYPDEDEDELLFEDEDDYLTRQMNRTKINESDGSYDLDDYDEDADFDEDGNLLTAGYPSIFKNLVTRRTMKPDGSDSDSDDS